MCLVLSETLSDENPEPPRRQERQERQRSKAITAEAQRRRGNAEKSYNRKGAKAQRKAAKNRISDFVLPLFSFAFLCVSAPLRLQLFLICFLAQPRSKLIICGT
jgi:hypothetical protein